MTETELERMVIRIVGDATLYERMLLRAQMMSDKTAKTILKLGREIEKFGTSIYKAGQKLTLALTLPLGFMAKKGVEEFSRFDKAMTETFAKMGRVAPQVRKDMEELAKSLSMSGTTVFSPTELAMGYEALASAGLDAKRSMATLPAVAKFAQAGAFDLHLAVKLIVGSMASFGELSKDPVTFAKNLEHFSDVIVGVANQTTTGVEEVARAMSADAAVAARGYGMELEELGAILGVFALNNKDAEEAGNLTGRAIRLMTATFIKNKEVWKSMGIDLVDEATGKWVKFADAIGMLEKAFEGMEGPQRVSTLLAMGFETLTLKAILPLVGMSDELRRQTQLYKELGITTEMATIQGESFSNQMKSAWNAVKVFDIELGEVLAPLLLRIGDYLKQLVTYWKSLSQEMKQNIVIVGGLAAAIGPLLIVLGSMIWSVGQLTTAFVAFRATLPLIIGLLSKVVLGANMVYAGVLAMIMPIGGATTALGALAIKLATVWPLLAAVVALVSYKVARPFGDWLFGVNEFNKSLEKSIELNNQIMAQLRARQNIAFNSLMGIEDPGQKFEAVKAAVKLAKLEVDGYKASIKGAEKEVQALNTTWNWLVGAKTLELAVKELADLKAKAGLAQTNLERLNEVFQTLKPGVVPGGMPLGQEIPVPTELETGTQELIARLKEQIDTVGMTSDEVELYKLTLMGLDAPQERFIQSLIRGNEALKEQAQLADDVAELERSLTEQINTFGMSTSQIELYKLAMRGATEEDLAWAKSLQENLDVMKAHEARLDKARSLTEKYMDPQKKFAETSKELFNLYKDGLITLDTYNAAMRDAEKQAGKNYDVHASFTSSGIDAVAADSAEALSRINTYKMNLGMKPLPTASGQAFQSSPPELNQPKTAANSNDTGTNLGLIAGYLKILVDYGKAESKRPIVIMDPSNLTG